MRLEPAAPARRLEAIRAPFLEVPVHVLDAPVVQPLGLLLELAGETLRERLFVVQAPDGGAEACLRPDFTIPALQAHIASRRSAGRYFYDGPAFRVAPAGSTRAEEFPQIGVEAFEDGDRDLADAQMAALAWRAAAAGGRDDLTLLLGDIGLFAMVVEALGLPPPLATRLTRAFSNPRKLRAELAAASDGAETIPRGGDRLAAILSSLPEAEARAVLEEIWALAGIEPVGGRTAAEIVHRLGERSAVARAPRLTAAQAQVIGRFLAISGEPAAALDEVAALVGSPSSALDAARQAWARRVDALVDAGTPRARMRLSAAFGRPFGYYDGMVFEVRSAALGDDQPVAAGGRYDGLPERLGANLTTGALGCMVRPGRAWVEGLR